LSVKNRTDLVAEIVAQIKANGAEEITGPILQAILNDMSDSSVNMLGDTGILAKLGYATLVAITNPGDITHKNYVDTVASTLSDLKLNIDGTSEMTGPLYFSGPGFIDTSTLDVLSIGSNSNTQGVIFGRSGGIVRFEGLTADRVPYLDSFRNLVSSAVTPTELALLSGISTALATQAYADALVVGLWDDRGNYNASVNTFPASGGSGSAGAVKKGDIWTVSVAGTLGGHAVTAGDTVRALVDTPGQTDSNWAIAENNIGYVAENSANKDTDGTLASNSDTKYPSQKAVKTYADTKQTALGFTPENSANKDATGGYAGLTLFKINFKNALNTFTSFFTNSNTAARTYTFQDRNGTIADDTDLGLKQSTLVSGTNIKTINGSSLLGSGDLTVSTTFANQSEVNAGTVSNKAIAPDTNKVFVDSTAFINAIIFG
jgi:hypothetical protein